MYLREQHLTQRSSIPLYLQLHAVLRDYLETNEAKQQGKLPCEIELCRQFGVSRNTVKQALSMLAEAGLVVRIKRRGTVIAGTLDHCDPRANKHAIGLVFPLSQKWHSAINGIEKEVTGHGYAFEIYSYRWYDASDQAYAINRARKNCAGIILYPDGNGDDRDAIRQLLHEHYPFTLFDLYCEELNCSSVSINNLMGGYELARALLAQGCRRIGCLVFNSHLISAKRRLEGFERALQEANITPDPALYGEVYEHASGQEVITQIMKQKPDGIFCTRFFPKIIAEMRQQQLFVPFAKFDDDIELSNLPFPIFAADQPEFELGTEAARLLCRKLAHPEEPNRQVFLAPEIHDSKKGNDFVSPLNQPKEKR